MKLFFLDYTDLFGIYMATTSKILIPDGTRLCFQQVKFSVTRFWKVCTKWEYEGLINSKHHWLCTNKKSIRSIETGFQKLKTLVKRRTDQRIRTRIFQARDERIETGLLVETQKGKMSALKGKQENAISGQQKDSVPREMLAPR